MISKILKDLETGVGASEAHHLFSLSPYGCRRRLWLEKRRAIPDFPAQETFDMRRGKGLEAVAADLYRERTGQQITRGYRLVRRPDNPQMLAHPDGYIGQSGNGHPLVYAEIKAPSLWHWNKIRRDGAPPGWLLQVQHGLAAAGMDEGLLLIFSAEKWDLIPLEVKADNTIGEKISEEVKGFWRQVQDGPEPVRLDYRDPRCKKCPYRTQCQGEAMLKLRDEEPAGDIEVDDSLNPLVTEYLQAKELVDQAEEFLEGAKGKLIEKMGDRQRVACQHGRVHYSVQERVTIDTKRLRANQPDLAKSYEQKSVARTLRVYE